MSAMVFLHFADQLEDLNTRPHRRRGHRENIRYRPSLPFTSGAPIFPNLGDERSAASSRSGSGRRRGTVGDTSIHDSIDCTEKEKKAHRSAWGKVRLNILTRLTKV